MQCTASLSCLCVIYLSVCLAFLRTLLVTQSCMRAIISFCEMLHVSSMANVTNISINIHFFYIVVQIINVVFMTNAIFTYFLVVIFVFIDFVVIIAATSWFYGNRHQINKHIEQYTNTAGALTQSHWDIIHIRFHRMLLLWKQMVTSTKRRCILFTEFVFYKEYFVTHVIRPIGCKFTMMSWAFTIVVFLTFAPLQLLQTAHTWNVQMWTVSFDFVLSVIRHMKCIVMLLRNISIVLCLLLDKMQTITSVIWLTQTATLQHTRMCC